MTTSEHTLMACHDCDLLQGLGPVRPGERAMCLRCGAVLYRGKGKSLEHTITLLLAGLVLFVLANVFPFMTFKLQGRVQESILFSGVKELFQQDMWVLAGLVLGVSIVVPALKILGMLYVLLPLEFNRRPWKGVRVFRMVETWHPWAMMDVYMLGVLVAIVKLADLATLVPGIALYSFATLIVMLAAADAALDPHVVWEKLAATR